ncbi:MAG: cysteine hydrolase [Methylobacillus sp.]|jgi:nicotinamidase-related amidase|nr:cysteine hydrolase [Methylobacillus sp.]
MSELKTLRDLVGLGDAASAVANSALIIIDAQNTYCEGIMKLDGMDKALAECKVLLDRFRAARRPIFHIRHDAGVGTPYDVNSRIGQIVDLLTPANGEPVITKNYPSSFAQTQLDALLKQAGIENLILVGFMSHMCVNSTARAAFDMGYRPTVVASATATRALPLKTTGESIPSAQIHTAALAALSDLPAAVVASSADVPTE